MIHLIQHDKIYLVDSEFDDSLSEISYLCFLEVYSDIFQNLRELCFENIKSRINWTICKDIQRNELRNDS